MLPHPEFGNDRWSGETEAASLQRTCFTACVSLCLFSISLLSVIQSHLHLCVCTILWCLLYPEHSCQWLHFIVHYSSSHFHSLFSQCSVIDIIWLHGQIMYCMLEWNLCISSASFFSPCSDPRWGTVSEAISVAEPQYYRVDLSASGPLAHGPQLRTPYPRIHCQKHRWRTAATAR